MTDIEERFANHGGDWRFVYRELSRRFNVQRKSRPRPTEYGLANVTLLRSATRARCSLKNSVNFCLHDTEMRCPQRPPNFFAAVVSSGIIAAGLMAKQISQPSFSTSFSWHCAASQGRP